jgi:hypothetical protein
MPSTCQGDIGLSALIPLSNALSVAPTLNTIVHFVNLASRLKDDILLTQPAFVSPLQPPSTLPPSARQFLSDACGLPPPDIDCCWDTLKGVIWEPLNLPQDRVERDFTNYGHSRGFSTSVASHFITHICSFHVSITDSLPTTALMYTARLFSHKKGYDPQEGRGTAGCPLYQG